MRVWNLRVESLDSFLAGSDKMLRFCFVVIDRANDPLNVRELCLRERLERRIGFEKLRSHLVHFFVGALSGEHTGDQQLVLVFKVEFRVGIRVQLRERLNEKFRIFRGHWGGFYKVLPYAGKMWVS